MQGQINGVTARVSDVSDLLAEKHLLTHQWVLEPLNIVNIPFFITVVIHRGRKK